MVKRVVQERTKEVDAYNQDVSHLTDEANALLEKAKLAEREQKEREQKRREEVRKSMETFSSSSGTKGDGGKVRAKGNRPLSGAILRPKNPSRGQYSPLRNRKTREIGHDEGKQHEERQQYPQKHSTLSDGTGKVEESYYIALYDLEANMPGDLTLHAGNLIRVKESDKGEENWWMGFNMISEEFGAFPKNFVKLADEKHEVDAMVALLSQNKSGLVSGKSVHSLPNSLSTEALNVPFTEFEEAKSSAVSITSSSSSSTDSSRGIKSNANGSRVSHAAVGPSSDKKIPPPFEHQNSTTAMVQEKNAAVRIQSQFRRQSSFQQAMALKKSQSDAATVIQKKFRKSHSARSILQKNEAATKVQRLFRSKSGRGNFDPATDRQVTKPSKRSGSKVDSSKEILRLSNKCTADVISTVITLFSTVNVQHSAAPLRLFEIRDMIQSRSLQMLLVGVSSIREVLTADDRTQSKLCLEALGERKVIHRLLEILSKTSCPEGLMTECLWTLSTLAAMDYGKMIFEEEDFSSIYSFLHHPNPQVAEQATWVIGNIAAGDIECRDRLLETKQPLEFMLKHLNSENALPAIQVVSIWAISNLCRGSPPPKTEDIAFLIPEICDFVTRNAYSQMMLIDGCWCLAYLTDESEELRLLLIKENMASHFVQTLSRHTHGSSKLLLACMRVIGNLVSSTNPAAAHDVLREGILNELNKVFQLKDPVLIKEALWVLSNLSCGSAENLSKIVVHHTIMKFVVDSLLNDGAQIYTEALWVLNNLILDGTGEQLDHIMQCHAGFLNNILKLLDTSSEPQAVQLCVKVLGVFLTKGASKLKDMRTQKGFSFETWFMQLIELRSKISLTEAGSEFQQLLDRFRSILN